MREGHSAVVTSLGPKMPNNTAMRHPLGFVLGECGWGLCAQVTPMDLSLETTRWGRP